MVFANETVDLGAILAGHVEIGNYEIEMGASEGRFDSGGAVEECRPAIEVLKRSANHFENGFFVVDNERLRNSLRLSVCFAWTGFRRRRRRAVAQRIGRLGIIRGSGRDFQD